MTDAGDGLGATWVDFDSDGDLDLHLVNLLGPDRLFRNDDGRFTDVAPALGIGQGEAVNSVWGDFDGDGAPDLFEAKVGMPALYRGSSDGNEVLTVRVPRPLSTASGRCGRRRMGWPPLGWDGRQGSWR